MGYRSFVVHKERVKLHRVTFLDTLLWYKQEKWQISL